MGRRRPTIQEFVHDMRNDITYFGLEVTIRSAAEESTFQQKVAEELASLSKKTNEAFLAATKANMHYEHLDSPSDEDIEHYREKTAITKVFLDTFEDCLSSSLNIGESLIAPQLQSYIHNRITAMYRKK